MGASANVMGETVASFRIGENAFEFQILVADIQKDVILGMNTMTNFGFKLDLESGIFKEVVLNQRKELSACDFSRRNDTGRT